MSCLIVIWTALKQYLRDIMPQTILCESLYLRIERAVLMTAEDPADHIGIVRDQVIDLICCHVAAAAF